jgi:hypothetical protein
MDIELSEVYKTLNSKCQFRKVYSKFATLLHLYSSAMIPNGVKFVKKDRRIYSPVGTVTRRQRSDKFIKCRR